MAAWLVAIRAANSRCVSPAAPRASRTCSPMANANLVTAYSSPVLSGCHSTPAGRPNRTEGVRTATARRPPGRRVRRDDDGGPGVPGVRVLVASGVLVDRIAIYVRELGPDSIEGIE